MYLCMLVCDWQHFICTDECVTCFLMDNWKRTLHWRMTGRGVDAVQETVFFFFFGKRQKAVAVIETFFQLVSAYFDLFLYCDGK